LLIASLSFCSHTVIETTDNWICILINTALSLRTNLLKWWCMRLWFYS